MTSLIDVPQSLSYTLPIEHKPPNLLVSDRQTHNWHHIHVMSSITSLTVAP